MKSEQSEHDRAYAHFLQVFHCTTRAKKVSRVSGEGKAGIFGNARIVELWERYLSEERLRGHTEKGLRMLAKDVRRFLSYLAESGIAPDTLALHEAQDYQGWLVEHGRRDGSPLRRSTIAGRIKAASNFAEFLRRSGNLLSNPFRDIVRVREEKTLPRGILKEDQMLALLDHLRRWDRAPSMKDQVTRYRVHVIAELQYATGMRIGEVADLKADDLDLEREFVTIREPKNGKPRTAFLTDYAKEVLRMYVAQLREVTMNGWNRAHGEFLFASGWEVLTALVNRHLTRACTELGLPRMTSHGFRHALGYHLLRAGCSIRHIQQILGHEALHSTEVYTKVDREDLRAVLTAYHPRVLRRPGDERP